MIYLYCLFGASGVLKTLPTLELLFGSLFFLSNHCRILVNNYAK